MRASNVVSAPVLLAWRHVAGVTPQAARQRLLDARPGDVAAEGTVASQLVLEAFRADLSGFQWSWGDAGAIKRTP